MADLYYCCRRLSEYSFAEGLATDRVYDYTTLLSWIVAPYWGLEFTNNPPETDNWYPWTPGLTSFIWTRNSSYSIPKSKIFDITTYNNEIVKLPADSTGLFSNFINLGMSDTSVLSWDPPSSGSGPGSWANHLKEYVFDASRFDVSEVENMSSIFEGTFSHPSIGGYGWTPGGRPNCRLYYMRSKITLKDINGWDTRNVKYMDRAFANMNIGNAEYDNHDPFLDGIVWNCDNLVSAENMFAGSFFRLGKFTLVFKDNQSVKLDHMFNNFTNGNYGKIEGSTDTKGLSYTLLDIFPTDLSDWVFKDATGFSFNSMFRNCRTSSIKLGPKFSNAVCQKAAAGNSINYMFLYDSSTTTIYSRYSSFSSSYRSTISLETQLKSILVPIDTDWAIQSEMLLDGYKMFHGSTKLPNFDSDSVNIERANTKKDYGYFDMLPPEKIQGNYVKTVNGWKLSTIYVKTDAGWKESEVYK